MKKMKQKNSDVDVDVEVEVKVKVAKEPPPYKVLFPGQRRISGATNSRYALRDFKDPRITKFPPFEKSRLGRLYRAQINRKFEDETKDEDEDEDETYESDDVSIDELRKLLDKNEVQTGKLDDESEGQSRMFVDETEDKDENEDESEGESTEDDIPAAATVVTMVFSDSDEELLDVKEDKDEIRKRSLEHAERLKKDYYRRVKELPQQLKDQDCQCAEAAIKFYNEKQGTDYEIVETLGSYDTLYIGFWYHCNFKAQRKSVSGSGRRSSPKLFFAELYRTQYVLNVNLCKMLDGRGQRPHLVRGCEICCNQMWHPVEGFKVGKYTMDLDSDSN